MADSSDDGRGSGSSTSDLSSGTSVSGEEDNSVGSGGNTSSTSTDASQASVLENSALAGAQGTSNIAQSPSDPSGKGVKSTTPSTGEESLALELATTHLSEVGAEVTVDMEVDAPANPVIVQEVEEALSAYTVANL